MPGTDTMPSKGRQSVPTAGKPNTARQSAEPASAATTEWSGKKAGPDASPADRAEKRPRLVRPSAINVKMIYAAYLSSLALPPVAIIAVFFAHQARSQRPQAWLMSHYTYQVRTFWIGLGAHLVAYATLVAGIGLLLLPLIAIWVVARSVHGLTMVARHEPIFDPHAYFI